MIAEGYGDRRTLERRINGMESWLANPSLLEGDADAEYAAVIEIDLAEITQPICVHQTIRMMLACCLMWLTAKSTKSLSVPV